MARTVYPFDKDDWTVVNCTACGVRYMIPRALERPGNTVYCPNGHRSTFLNEVVNP